MFVSSFVFGCTWSNTVWVAEKQVMMETHDAIRKPIKLLSPTETTEDKYKLLAIVEARGTKDSATPVLLLEEAILQAKKMSADAIQCPTKPTPAAPSINNLVYNPADVKAAVDLATQFIQILKDIIALPFTLVSTVKQSFTSEQTLGCFTYKKL